MFDTNLAILLAVIGGTVAVAATLKLWSYAKASSAAPKFFRTGRPTLVYFWTPTCADCRNSQSRIVDSVTEDVNTLEVIKVNAHDAPEQAKAFGIFTVPTTVVLGADGRVHTINTGLVDQATLRTQVEAVDRKKRGRSPYELLVL